LLFEQLKEIRNDIKIPVLLMGYLNPVLQFGIQRFCEKCNEVGVDGVILPDLPMHEYEQLYMPFFKENNLLNIFLVTPQTSNERIQKIDALSEGFIYAVAVSSTTGTKQGEWEEQQAYFKKLKTMQLKNPFMIGFGISNGDAFRRACQYASGAIVGSAFVNFIRERNTKIGIAGFIKQLR